ncbi:sigma-54-dependent Fis family transcriptional regulator [Paraliobacillus sp. X-1268]|uniref:sigma-54 interaction domain-containing protein n=1 Tax=Paraliobacillus sp. X-1268 TaxID=2213193 RepID=UPI000E3D9D55|nr:sigma 54-interacting transcriptional regulator [Paraliobacillus sp. X-1268]
MKKKVLIIGGDNATNELIKHINSSERMEIQAVIANQKNNLNLKLAKDNQIKIDEDWRNWLDNTIDIVFETTGSLAVLDELQLVKSANTIIVSKNIEAILTELMEEKEKQISKLKTQRYQQNLILDNIHESKMLEAVFHSSDEAISVVDEKGHGIMINPAYTRITGLTEDEIIGKPATVDISEGQSMHKQVLVTRKPVRGVQMKVGPAKKAVIVNVSPIIVDGILKGSVGVLHDVSEIQHLTKELMQARKIIRNLESKYTFDDIIGQSDEMELTINQAKVVAKTAATVLLRGESGTGKELFAHAIHHASDRRRDKFIRVNCAAITESILESELFGYEEGAFSGANRGGKKGYFEAANNGSIFLDEIGELSLHIQAKLLRVLQENEIVRVGASKPISVDVRVITATNVNLEEAIREGRFREDLYYRLNRLPIYIPALRERSSDFKEMVSYLINKINLDYGRNIKTISKDALEYLKEYHWPGNVRELENVISRSIIYMQVNEEVIKKENLPQLIAVENGVKENEEHAVTSISENSNLQDTLDTYEKKIIAQTLAANNYNKTKTARILNISIRSLYYKIEKHHIAGNGMQ